MTRLSFYLALMFTLFSMFHESALADTIPENAQIYGIWNYAGSPYVIMGLATIPIDSTLTIEPGVQVKFKSSTNDSAFVIQHLDIGWIIAYGKLIAIGSETDSIIFTSLGEGRWGGIHFINGMESTLLKYCKIEKCKSLRNEMFGDSYCGGLTFNNTHALIENSNLSNNDFGLFATNSAVNLISCYVSYNATGATYVASVGKIISSKFYDNNDLGILSHTSSVIIENNILEEALEGIDSYESFDTITGNVIRNNLWGGIDIIRCNPLVFRNIIYGSNSGIRFSGRPRIVNNTIVNNKYFGIYCDWQAKPYIINNIIYGNNSLIKYYAGDTVVFANNLLQVNAIPEGLIDAGGNIFNEDPKFVDTVNEIFSLDSGSPCFETGIDYFEWGGEVILEMEPGQYTGIAPDIGAIESTSVGIKNDFSLSKRQNMMFVYPNPATNKVLLTSRYVMNQIYVSISTVSGQLLLQNEYYNQDKIELDISAFSAGIYILKTQTNKGVETLKLIVQ